MSMPGPHWGLCRPFTIQDSAPSAWEGRATSGTLQRQQKLLGDVDQAGMVAPVSKGRGIGRSGLALASEELRIKGADQLLI